MTITVCKDCQERYPACWGSCPKYLAARAEHEKKKEAIYNSYRAERSINTVRYHGLCRRRKETEK